MHLRTAWCIQQPADRTGTAEPRTLHCPNHHPCRVEEPNDCLSRTSWFPLAGPCVTRNGTQPGVWGRPRGQLIKCRLAWRCWFGPKTEEDAVHAGRWNFYFFGVVPEETTRDRPAIIPSSDNGSSLPRVDPGPISGGRTVKPHPVLTAGERGVVASAEHNEAPRPQQRTTTTTHAFVAVTACQRAINILPQPAGATRRDPRRSNVVLRAHNIRIERPSAGGWRECCAVFGQCVCVCVCVARVWNMVDD